MDIQSGAILDKFGVLEINVGSYPISKLTLYNGEQAFVPIAMTETTLTYNIVTNGDFTLKYEGETIFNFKVEYLQDFTIDFIATSGTGEEPGEILSEGTYNQRVQPTTAYKRYIRSTGEDIKNLPLTAVNGTIELLSEQPQRADSVRVKVLGTDLTKNSEFYVGNVLVIYYTART